MFAHVDMNSYFASVEQQANPHWRGRPLGVCAYLHKNGCVIAASIEAKKKGAKVGMSLQECREVCPDMVFVQNDPPKYRVVTSKVFSILHELTDKVEHYSIDEAFLDLTGWYRDTAEAAWALCRARMRIQSEVGDWLKCSIGIAPSKFLAKLASDLEKPNGLVILTPENIDAVLSSLEIEEAWGIGSRIRRRLNKLGIYNLLELKHYPVGNLMRVLGKAGWLWHERLHCRDVDRFEQYGERPPKSVGHSFCVPRRANDNPATILAILIKLTERAGRRLRSFGLFAKSMSVQVGFWEQTPLPPFHKGESLLSHSFFSKDPLVKGEAELSSRGNEGGFSFVAFSEPANDIFSITDGAARALESIWDGRSKVSFLAVTLLDLVPPNGQQELPFLSSSGEFDETRGSRKLSADFISRMGLCRRQASSGMMEGVDSVARKKRTSKAVDAIRDRYGEDSIIFASMLGLTKDYAPDRIGFRKTEGVDV